MIIVSSWDYNEQVIDVYRRHNLKTTFFCNKIESLDGFEVGVYGNFVEATKKSFEEKGHIVKGYAGEIDIDVAKGLGFSYVRVGPRWYFSIENLDPFRIQIPVHVDISSTYFWDIYLGQRDYFIFSGHGECNEDHIIRMINDGHEFIDMITLVESLAIKKIHYS